MFFMFLHELLAVFDDVPHYDLTAWIFWLVLLSIALGSLNLFLTVLAHWKLRFSCEAKGKKKA